MRKSRTCRAARQLEEPCRPSQKKIRRVAVLGSGTVREKDPVYRQAMELGAALARQGMEIFHGGYGGVMEAVARGCRNAGGRNAGITIQKRSGKSSNPWMDLEIPMRSWKGRLFKLIEKGDAYVFLDGATGTLNELFFVWEMTNKRLLDKPILVLGKRLRGIVKSLKKDPALKIPPHFHLVSSIPQVIRHWLAN